MIIYLVLSIVYLHIIYALDADISAININRFKGLLLGMPYLIIFTLFLSMSLFLVKRYSKYLLLLFSFFIFYKSFSIFILNFDKLILILNVVYVLISYNIYILFDQEMNRSIYKPDFLSGSIDVDLYKLVDVELISDRSSQVLRGKLVNFDDNSLVIYTDNTNINGPVKLTLKYNKSIFSCSARIMTKYDNGLGLQVVSDKNDNHELDWQEFYSIKESRGFV